MEQFCICEINARFCWNGFLHAAYGQKALGAEQKGFVGRDVIGLAWSWILTSIQSNVEDQIWRSGSPVQIQ
jgi:hypothetical protein